MKIELDSEIQVITVDNVAISLELLRSFANPDPDMSYRLARVGNVVTVKVEHAVVGLSNSRFL